MEAISNLANNRKIHTFSMSTTSTRRYVWDEDRDQDSLDKPRGHKLSPLPDNSLAHSTRSKTQELDDYLNQMSVSTHDDQSTFQNRRTPSKSSAIQDVSLSQELSSSLYRYDKDSRRSTSSRGPIDTSAHRTPSPKSRKQRLNSGFDDPESFEASRSSERIQRSVDNHSKRSPKTSELSKTIDDLQNKIEGMKTELSDRSKEALSLHADLRRIQTAKERRMEKFYKEWNEKISLAREEGQTTLSKQNELASRVKHDIESLKTKLQNLEDKTRKFDRDYEDAIRSAQEEVHKKRQRHRKQLEIDERTSRDKVLASKDASLKKQAADSFGPMIDELVLLNKESILRQKQDIEASIESLALELDADSDRLYQDRLRRLQDECNQYEANRKRQHDEKLAEILNQHASDITQLRSKASRDHQMLNDQIEARVRSDAEDVAKAIQTLQQEETKQIQAIISNHQRDLSKASRHYDESLQQLQRELELDLEKYELKSKETLKKMQEDEAKQRIERKQRLVERETAEVLEKVRNELLMERTGIQSKIEAEVEEKRSRAHTKVMAIQDDLDHSLKHLSFLKEQGSKFAMSKRNLEREITAKTETVGSAYKRIDQLKAEVKRLEAQLATMTPSSENMSQRQVEWEAELKVWRERRDLARTELQNHSNTAASQVNEKKKQLEAQLQRIRDKIDRLLASKISCLGELQQEKKTLEDSRENLEEQLEIHREEHVNEKLQAALDKESGKETTKPRAQKESTARKDVGKKTR